MPPAPTAAAGRSGERCRRPGDDRVAGVSPRRMVASRRRSRAGAGRNPGGIRGPGPTAWWPSGLPTALTGLSKLELNNNQIEDISPLIANTGLGQRDSVFLEGNPLSDEAINEQIPTPEGQGSNGRILNSAAPPPAKPCLGRPWLSPDQAQPPPRKTPHTSFDTTFPYRPARPNLPCSRQMDGVPGRDTKKPYRWPRLWEFESFRSAPDLPFLPFPEMCSLARHLPTTGRLHAPRHPSIGTPPGDSGARAPEATGRSESPHATGTDSLGRAQAVSDAAGRVMVESPEFPRACG